MPKPSPAVRVVPFTVREHRGAFVDVLLRVRGGNPTYPPPNDAAHTPIAFADWLCADVALSRWVAMVGPHVVGHVQLTPPHRYLTDYLATMPDDPYRDVSLAEIGKLYADPNYSQHGVGSALLAHARTQASASDRAPVLAVVDTSEAAYRLYRRAGMSEVGSFAGIHGLNHILVDTVGPNPA